MACEDPDCSTIRGLGGLALLGAGVDVVAKHQTHVHEQIVAPSGLPPVPPADASAEAQRCMDEIKAADLAVRRAGPDVALDGPELRAAEQALARARALRLPPAEVKALEYRVESVRRAIRSLHVNSSTASLSAAQSARIGRKLLAFSQLTDLDKRTRQKALEVGDRYAESAVWIQDPNSFNMSKRPDDISPEFSAFLNEKHTWQIAAVNSGGPGSTAEAVRVELATGRPVKFETGQQKWHGVAAFERILQIQAWVKSHPNLCEADRRAATEIIIDLRNSLSFTREP